jgi:ketosteroid isomerase-like protein
VFDWLYEGWDVVYVLLGLVAVGLLWLWKQTPRRAYLIAAAVCLVLIGIYFLLDRQVETDREQIQRKITEMAAAVQTRDVERIFQHISPNFHAGEADRAGFRQDVERALPLIDKVEVWGSQFPENFRQRTGQGAAAEETARVEFFAKPSGGTAGNAGYYLVRAVMRRDPDGQWRLQSYEVFTPAGSNEPVAVPHLPH